jgi:hypothetical protein
MLKNHFCRFVFVFLALLLASMACSSTTPATPTPTATNTSLPTSTPEPTFTPEPTSTFTPVPTATPIPELGKPVSSRNWEVTVIDVVYRDRIYPGGGYYYDPNPGYMFIDVGLKVDKLGSKSSVLSTDIVVIDENGELWPALWSGDEDASDGEVDPYTIGMDSALDEDLDISTEKYLRLAFVLKEESLGKEVYFRFEDVPAVPFTIEK